MELSTRFNGKRAAFLLAFDDGCPSQLEFVIPELIRREIPGTFYINAAADWYVDRRERWAEAVRSPYILLGNHTYTHTGVRDAGRLEEEMARANEEIRQLTPHLPWPRVISFARPGGVPWEVDEQAMKEACARHRLIPRPAFHGPPMRIPTIDEMRAYIADTIERGTIGHIDFHGVGGDWHVASPDYFRATLDELERRRDDLWLTDAATCQQRVSQPQP